MNLGQNKYLAACLSFFLPGLGQWLINRDRAKGISLICMSAGVWISFYLSLAGPPLLRSRLTAIFMTLIYLFIWIPAVNDAFRFAQGFDSSLLSGRNRGYVILMLVMIGPLALPMLWQSERFSLFAKRLWTFAVVAIFIICTALILFVVPEMVRILEQYGIDLGPLLS